MLEAPRRVLLEGVAGSGKTTLALRLLHAWATGEPWAAGGIQLALLVPLRELRGGVSLSHYITKELLPKSLNTGSSFWKWLALLEERLLLVLDGCVKLHFPKLHVYISNGIDVVTAPGKIFSQSNINFLSVIDLSTSLAHYLTIFKFTKYTHEFIVCLIEVRRFLGRAYTSILRTNLFQQEIKDNQISENYFIGQQVDRVSF